MAINTVAATKKFNTMPMSVTEGESAVSNTLTENQYFFIWCPTYLDRFRAVETDATRNKRDIYFRGVKERWFVRTDAVPWTHRRIVFWSRDIIADATPFTQDPAQIDGPRTTLRPLGGRSRLTLSGDYALLNSMFTGQENRDWVAEMLWDAKFDNQRYKVLSDTRKVFNPGNDTGIMGVYNTWVEINTPLKYADDESGDDVVSGPGTGWASDSAKSPGNLYFLDVFSRGPAAVTDGPLLLSNQATIYWHEK